MVKIIALLVILFSKAQDLEIKPPSGGPSSMPTYNYPLAESEKIDCFDKILKETKDPSFPVDSRGNIIDSSKAYFESYKPIFDEYLKQQSDTIINSVNKCEKKYAAIDTLNAINARILFLKNSKYLRQDLFEVGEFFETFKDLKELSKKTACLKNYKTDLDKNNPKINQSILSFKAVECGFSASELKALLPLGFFEIDESDYEYINCKKISGTQLEQVANALYYDLTDSQRFLSELKMKTKPIVDQELVELNRKLAAAEIESKKFKKILCLSEISPEVSNNIRNATVKGTSEIGHGSFFYVDIDRSSKNISVVSAQHVVSHEDKATSTAVSLLGLRGSKKPLQFNISPGNYDRANDAVIKSIGRSRNKGLDVVSTSDQPKPGQYFYTVGYPSLRDRKYTILKCQYKGYQKNISNDRYSYQLHCPSAEGLLSGISGGPLVDDKGRVWGVNHAHTASSHTLLVTPLSKDKNNNLKIGVQSTFLTNDCYDDDLITKKTCHIMPAPDMQ